MTTKQGIKAMNWAQRALGLHAWEMTILVRDEHPEWGQNAGESSNAQGV